MKRMKRVLRILVSPLLIGAVLGTSVPLTRYECVVRDSEIHRGYKQQLLQNLASDVVIGCIAGLVVGVIVDACLQRLGVRKSSDSAPLSE